jgi:hypothetical protein
VALAPLSPASARDAKWVQVLAGSDHMIVPGQRVGPVRIGMGWDEVLQLMGQPDWSHTKIGNNPMEVDTQLRYGNMTIYFNTSATPKVYNIGLDANCRPNVQFGNMVWSYCRLSDVFASFKTSEGIGLGATSFEVSRALGDYTDPGGSGIMMRYSQIVFTITRDHRVWHLNTSDRPF